VYEALSYSARFRSARVSVWGLKLLVYEALSYSARFRSARVSVLLVYAALSY
jgi:hypothetical protein